MMSIFSSPVKKIVDWVIVGSAFNPSIQEAEAGGSLQVQGQPGLHSEILSQNKAYKTLERVEIRFVFQRRTVSSLFVPGPSDLAYLDR